MFTACTASAHTVASGELFAGPYMSVKAPGMGKWFLKTGPTPQSHLLAARSATPFIAEVGMFRLAPTATPEDFEALIKRSSDPDVDVDPNHPDRYELQERSIRYSRERPYPCVRYRAVTKDNRG